MQAMMMKMSLLVPLITGILQEPLVKMGFGAQGGLMNAAMQIKVRLSVSAWLLFLGSFSPAFSAFLNYAEL